MARRCVKHPQTETFIRCSKCDAPVCAECMVTGPVGIRCPGCARGKRTVLFQPKPLGALRAGGFALAVALGLGWVIRLVPFIGAAGIGYLIGEVVLRAGGRKRGRLIESIAGGTAALAVLLYTVPWLMIFTLGIIGLMKYLMSLGVLITLASLVIAVVCAVGRVRYL
jgi:hypothetical protein